MSLLYAVSCPRNVEDPARALPHWPLPLELSVAHVDAPKGLVYVAAPSEETFRAYLDEAGRRRTEELRAKGANVRRVVVVARRVYNHPREEEA